jgi:IS5 family transposase
VLQTYYTLSDDQIEYQIHDWRNFRQFLGLEIGEQIPDAKTIWLFRNQLAEKELVEPLFERFGQQLVE